MGPLARLRERFAGTLWFVPSVMVVGAVALALVTTLLDDLTEGQPFTRFVFTGGTESSRAILQTVANAVITFTALVFTITIVALQLSSQQFSPRVLRTFLRDRQSQFALGTFIATFIYCLMVLRVITVGNNDGISIPSISMMVLLVLVLASVAMFVSYISHMAHSIRVSHIVAAVGDETRALIDRLPEADPAAAKNRQLFEQPVVHEIISPGPGSLNAVDHNGLVQLAQSKGLAFEMKRSVGDFVATGQTVVDVRGGEIDGEVVLSHLSFGLERSMQQDLGFGLRQLVDVAEKGLSPSLNDPTTAVMAIDQIHDILRRLAKKPFPETEHTDDEAIVRLIASPLQWEALIDLAFAEIRQFSGSSLQVTRRILAALQDLTEIALPERKEVLRREERLLKDLIAKSFDAEEDRRTAGQPDQQGIGSET
ncbi:MAG: DUF2254 domain-containing protein [Actinomycetota bacterium]